MAILTHAGCAERPGNQLFRAAAEGDAPTVRELLVLGEDPGARTASGLAPLHAAALGDRLEVARLLLAAGAPVDERAGDLGATPLILAARRGHERVCTLLLRHGASVKARTQLDGYTALHWAAERGHAEVVAALLDAGADVNEPTRDGRTALVLATNLDRAATARLLRERGGLLGHPR